MVRRNVTLNGLFKMCIRDRICSFYEHGCNTDIDTACDLTAFVGMCQRGNVVDDFESLICSAEVSSIDRPQIEYNRKNPHK